MRRTLVAGSLGALGGGALVMMGLSGALFGHNTPPATTIAAPASQVAVLDGDTLRLSGTVLRLSGVVAPVRGEACAAGPDCGGQAASALASLVRDRDVACHITGHDGLGRPSAHCNAAGQDVNLALVSAGWAHAGDGTLDAAERDARAGQRGLWRTH